MAVLLFYCIALEDFCVHLRITAIDTAVTDKPSDLFATSFSVHADLVRTSLSPTQRYVCTIQRTNLTISLPAQISYNPTIATEVSI
jgi:hypothetical protein